MFCRSSNADIDKYNNEISLLDDIISPIAILIILSSTMITNVIIGIIIKQEDEKSNVLLLLPLILVVILNVHHLELNVIRLSTIGLAVGYVIYDMIVVFKGQNIITNLIYLLISTIQLICIFISFI